MQISVTKSWRKSMSMRLDTSGNLHVRVPLFSSQKDVEQFLAKHTLWIEKQQKKFLDRSQEKNFYLFGEVFIPENPEQLEKFYFTQAKKYIIPRCEYLAKKYGFTYENINISRAQTRWGSCSSKKNMNFSYRLVMSPVACIDYVIIHELCHLRQMNHSQKFWKEVEKIMPAYKKHE